ncbi:hypothetical protein PMAYCL1PPCAC_21367, partial [Pristionchus mayeri]
LSEQPNTLRPASLVLISTEVLSSFRNHSRLEQFGNQFACYLVRRVAALSVSVLVSDFGFLKLYSQSR